MNKNMFYEICKASCLFYKPERKNPEHCYGFEKLVKLIENKKINIKKILSLDIKKFKNSNDVFLMEKICKICPFLKDGCDFRAGKGFEPCGGYKIFDILIETKAISKNF